MEENLEREKKVRADVEKSRRKVEADLKMTQEAVEELEHVKRDLEDKGRKSVATILFSHCCYYWNEVKRIKNCKRGVTVVVDGNTRSTQIADMFSDKCTIQYHTLLSFLHLYLLFYYNLLTVRECFKGDEASQWKRPKSTPRHAKTL